MNVNFQELPTDLTVDDLTLPLIVALIAGITYFLARWVVGSIGMRLLRRANARLAQELAQQRFLPALALLAPAFIVLVFDPALSERYGSAYDIFAQLVNCYLIVVVALALHRLINALEKFVIEGHQVNAASIRPIFRLLRVGNIALAVVLTVSVFANIPLTWVLAAIGIVVAAGSIVFSDMIYNVVSNIILKQRGLISVGDWLEVPALQIDGTIVRIGPQLVEVQNWDNTLATVPARYLMNNTFRNWEQMYRVGKRRIERYIYIDLETVRPLDDKLIADVHELPGIAAFLKNHSHTHAAALDTLTNVGLYRTYLMEFLEGHSQVAKDESLRVSNENATGEGLPMVIVAYLTETRNVPYHLMNAEIYEHALAVAPRFGLRVFQSPSGSDLQSEQNTQPAGTVPKIG